MKPDECSNEFLSMPVDRRRFAATEATLTWPKIVLRSVTLQYDGQNGDFN